MPLPRTLLTGIALAVLVVSTGDARAQGPATEYDGVAATGLALRRLANSARVLHIGAHPDDENTALFAPLALGRGADAAYLSLTRGEGGQNGIGPELGTALGLIRSEELLAARRLDGGDQFFTRAIDYGYSKNADEAFRHWPRDTLLADVVEVIRRYRPDVVISVWSGTPRDGHGQHEASGVVAREAVLAAGDPSRFPEQVEAGLRPHRPAAFYWSGRFSEQGPDVALSTGELDPLLGRSYHQVAMASRSRHRSQDMGVPQAPGPRRTAFDRVDPADPPPIGDRSGYGGVPADEEFGDASLFDGVDSLLSMRARRVASTPGPGRGGLGRVVSTLVEYERSVGEIRAAYNPLRPGAIVSALVEASAELDAAARLVRERTPLPGPSGDPIRELQFHLEDEADDLQRAMLLAANVRLDVVADQELVVPGQTFELELSVWNGGERPIRADPRPLLPHGWTAEPADGAGPRAGSANGAGPRTGAMDGPERTESGDRPGPRAVDVAPGQRVEVSYRVTVPVDAPPTTPYFLDPASPPGPGTDLYEWPPAADVRGQPFASDPVRGAFALRLGDAGFTAERAAAWIGLDRRSGEFRRPVRVVPEVSVRLEPDIAVIPTAADRRTVRLTARVRSQAPAPVAGEVRLDLPAGWSASPDRVPVELGPDAGERTLTFRVTAPDDVAAGDYVLGAGVHVDGRVHALGYQLVDYPHIAPHHLYEPAATRVEAFDVRVADVRVGYVRGAGDGVPEALDQLGVDWEPLGPDALASGDLSRFDVIVTGIRAYEVRPDLGAHNQRLLDWARGGGTLVVQYNKYEFPAGDFAPWPVSIDRPHGRVTDPAAPVTVLAPDHPALTTPNAIGPADWEGWVQERGLYFLESWSGPFQPLLAMADPGDEPLTGSLLVAPIGDGLYVYTGLSFFRQLPAGVPGAYRLFANLISLGATR